MSAMTMDMQTVETLCQLNTDFYRRQCRSFADTRHAPWPGWTRCLQAAGVIPADDVPGEKGPSSKQPPMQHLAAEPPAPYPRTLSVLDVACGNLRFESFLRERLPQTRLDLHAVDNCDSLAAEGQADGAVHFQHVDVMRALLEGVGWDEDEPAPLCDMTVCFGFMHHVPGRENRMNLMRELVRRTLPGGYVAVSFWQFLNDEGWLRRPAPRMPTPATTCICRCLTRAISCWGGRAFLVRTDTATVFRRRK